MIRMRQVRRLLIKLSRCSHQRRLRLCPTLRVTKTSVICYKLVLLRKLQSVSGTLRAGCLKTL
uniref:DNA primase/helicase n=1 Tax=uncultured marine virus TaxID=186617 RepID=A0A0F7L5Z2_9VIRU|nr:DNA primase/helicase [uncultured marine virus]